jgi:hypothetical protein
VTSDHQAFDSPGCIASVKGDAASPFQQPGHNDSRFQASQRRSDAVVNASAEGYVAAKHGTIEDDLVGVIELSRISVGRPPQQEDGGTSSNLGAPERCCLGHGPHQKAEWGFEAKHLFGTRSG